MSFISCNYIHTDRLIHYQYARIFECLCRLKGAMFTVNVLSRSSQGARC